MDDSNQETINDLRSKVASLCDTVGDAESADIFDWSDSLDSAVDACKTASANYADFSRLEVTARINNKLIFAI